MRENFRGLEAGPEHGGIGSVIDLATAKQVCKKVDHFTLESCRSFYSFNLKASLKIILFMSSWLQGPSSFVAYRVLWFFCFVL